jgi:hypothetical protein
MSTHSLDSTPSGAGARGAVQAGGALLVLGLTIAGIAAAGTPSRPAPGPPAFSGRIGPPKVTVSAAPSAAAATQSFTFRFTRPRTVAPFAKLTAVTATLTSEKPSLSIPGLLPGGTKAPLRAVAAGPGKWMLAVPPKSRINVPGTWTMDLSVLATTGQKWQVAVPLAIS